MPLSILITVVIFGLVIFVHELGHYIAARSCGVLVEEFALGMGPILISKQIGETLYSLRVLPIGGFCKMYGDDVDPLRKKDSEESVAVGFADVEPVGSGQVDSGQIDSEQVDSAAMQKRALNRKTVPQRIGIMAAGSLLNLVLAFSMFTVVVGTIGFRTTTIDRFSPDMPLEAAGARAGDRIVSIDGRRVRLFQHIRHELNTGGGRTVRLGVVRGGERLYFDVTPAERGGHYFFGFVPEDRLGLWETRPETGPALDFPRATVAQTVVTGFRQMRFFVATTVSGIGQLVTGRGSMNDLMGPVGIVGFIGGEVQYIQDHGAAHETPPVAVAQNILLTMVNFTAFFSVSLGIINMLPFPALDGGRVLFLIFEGVRRKPVPEKVEFAFHGVGFVLLMALMVMVFFNDIFRIFRA